MSTQSFIADVLPDARIASARTGVPVAVILAQWAIETGWGTSTAWQQGHNYAGVSYGGSVNSFADRATGLAAYITVMNQTNYSAVRSAGSDAGAALALGESPWAASHYAAPGQPKGSLLGQVIAQNNLTQYDAGQSGSPPATATNTALSVPGIASGVLGITSSGLRGIVLKGVLLAGGVTLVVLAGWKATSGAREAANTKVEQAAKLAAVAA